MGIADYGVQNNGAQDVYYSPSFRGTIEIDSLSTLNASLGASATLMTFQLNVVVGFQDSGNWYAYWVQDVFFIDTASNEVFIENNVWNFSGPGAVMYTSTIAGSGSIHSPGFYADGGWLTGILRYPESINLVVNTTLATGGQPSVQFFYDSGGGYVEYDSATFSFAHNLNYFDRFVVDGQTYTPIGTYYDAELVMGGPGNGSSTQLESGSVLNLDLEYWNGFNYQTVGDAMNYGSDTAETVSNVVGAGKYYTASGEMFGQITAGAGTLGRSWSAEWAGTVSIRGPTNSEGTLIDGNYRVPYSNGTASLTLYPGDYTLSVDAAGTSESCGTLTISAGSTATVVCPAYFTVVVAQSGLPPGSSWGVTIDSETPAAASTAITVYLPNGSYQYVFSGEAGYLPYPTGGTIDVAGSDVAVSVVWDAVSLTASASSGSVDVGQPVTFGLTSVSGLAGYAFAWIGLPAGCLPSDSATVSCTPSGPGVSPVSVELTQSNGFIGESPKLPFSTYPDPSVSAPVGSSRGADVGQTGTFTVLTTDGSGEARLDWMGLPPGCVPANSSEVACAYTSNGTYSIIVSIRDSNGFEANSTANFVVSPALSVGVPAASSTLILDGQSVTFSVEVEGGSGGLAYQWAGLPSGCVSQNSSTLSCTPAATGMSSITVTVVDSNGGSSRSENLNFTVIASFLGIPAIEGYLVVALAIVGVVSMVVLLVFRRKSPRNPGQVQPSRHPFSPLGWESIQVAAAEESVEPEPPTTPYWKGDPSTIPWVSLHCWNCGHDNMEGSRYCGICAVPLSRAAPSDS